MTELDFQRQVTELAEILGWSWVHFRPAQTSKGWRTPVSGPLGKGWVDLVLVRERDNRLIFAELKSDKGKCSVAQLEVHDTLLRAGQHVETWRPVDFDRIAEILR